MHVSPAHPNPVLVSPSPLDVPPVLHPPPLQPPSYVQPVTVDTISLLPLPLQPQHALPALQAAKHAHPLDARHAYPPTMPMEHHAHNVVPDAPPAHPPLSVQYAMQDSSYRPPLLAPPALESAMHANPTVQHAHHQEINALPVHPTTYYKMEDVSH